MMRFNFLCKVGFLFIWRSWRSTLALGIMILSAVTALVFLSALAVGTNDAMIRNSVRLFSGHITAEDLTHVICEGRIASSTGRWRIDPEKKIDLALRSG